MKIDLVLKLINTKSCPKHRTALAEEEGIERLDIGFFKTPLNRGFSFIIRRFTVSYDGLPRLGRFN